MTEHEPWKPFALFAMHCAVAAGAIGVGFIPEALLSSRYADTRLAAFCPCAFLTALVVGFFVNRHEKHRCALLVWVVGFCWLIWGASDFWRWEYQWTHEARFPFVMDSLFGTEKQCAASECLGEFLFTFPFIGAVGYAAGAALGLWAGRESLLPRGKIRRGLRT